MFDMVELIHRPMNKWIKSRERERERERSGRQHWKIKIAI